MNIKLKQILSTDLKDLPGEYWKDIPGHEDRYMISNYSRVKSVMKGKHVILRRSLSSGKYKVVLFKKGKLISENIGRLCASIFLRTPELNEVIRYKDGNCFNDHIDNLEWITKKDSNDKTLIRLRRSNRYVNSGSSNGMAIIDHLKAKEIREHRLKGKTYKQLSDVYGVSIPCIQKVVEGRTWKTA